MPPSAPFALRRKVLPMKPDLQIVRLDTGSHQVVHLVKMFGPLILCDIRIWVDGETGEWVIERSRETKDGVTNWEVAARVLGCMPEKESPHDAR